ncbi:MAG: ABC transporter ATP-binding protein [Epsilonproteobacteria bacterium]|nr:ABC transporter ATP-binding protein [Campylobacterota bacterium]
MNDVLLKIEGIKKSFGSKEALKGVSLDLMHGEVFSLLGVNGAGKTTLSSIIATLTNPTAGDITHKGKSIYKDICSYRRLIGYCPQKPNLNGLLTLRDNLVFAGKYFGMSKGEIDQRIDELASTFSIKQYLNDYAHVLSGGYKQRFVFARSLMHSPKLIILDEPTVALDPHIRKNLWKYISLIKEQGACVLLTTHYLDEAEVLSDRVCLLSDGVVKLIDTPKNLMATFQKGKLEDVFLELVKDSIEE